MPDAVAGGGGWRPTTSVLDDRWFMIITVLSRLALKSRWASCAIDMNSVRSFSSTT